MSHACILRQINRILIITLIFINYGYAKLPLPIVKIGSYRLQVAATPQNRTKGLQGVECIHKHTGMLFIYPAPTKAVYWTYGCHTAMDIIFLDIKGIVQGVVSATAPPATNKPFPEQYLLYTAHGPMTTSEVKQARLPQTAYVVEVPYGEGSQFAKTSAHLVPYAVITSGIKAN